MNDSRIPQVLALIDDARTLLADLIEEGCTGFEPPFVLLNKAVGEIQDMASGLFCRCGHGPASHTVTWSPERRRPCGVCTECRQPLRKHPDNHVPVPCNCTDMDMEHSR